MVGTVMQGPSRRKAAVAMPDRRRLAAAASALVASFAVVLAIGAFTGGSPSYHATAGAVRLTVSVTPARHGLAGGGPVSVLRAPSLAQAASGRLSSAGVLQVSVAEGAYFVCVRPPGGWSVADPAVMQLPGWSCLSRVLRAGRARVTFRLTPAAARTQVSNP
jgi:hypothetical protein